MGKARKQSLASRKRAKDVSRAMLDNTFKTSQKEVLQVEKFNDTSIPRSMRNLMRSIQSVKDVEAGKTVKVYSKFREDVPRVAGSHKGKKRARGSDEKSGPEQDPAHTADAASAVLPAAAPELEASAAGSSTQGTQSEPVRPKKKAKKKRAPSTDTSTMPETSGSKGGGSRGKEAKFGETNKAPPELMLSGHFAKRAAQAGVDPQGRMLALRREAVLQNYAASKARKGGNGGEAASGASTGGKHTFTAPFLSHPSTIF